MTQRAVKPRDCATVCRETVRRIDGELTGSAMVTQLWCLGAARVGSQVPFWRSTRDLAYASTRGTASGGRAGLAQGCVCKGWRLVSVLWWTASAEDITTTLGRMRRVPFCSASFRLFRASERPVVAPKRHVDELARSMCGDHKMRMKGACF